MFDQSDGRVLGVHIVGDDACEMIHYGMELVRGKRTIAEVCASSIGSVDSLPSFLPLICPRIIRSSKIKSNVELSLR